VISSRNLEDLLPVVKDMAEQLIEACKAAGVDLIIVSTYRDLEAQAEIYAKGRSTPGPIRTNAKPGESLHNWRVAIDFCPLEFGKAAWDDMAAFERVGELAETIGFEWAGRWTGRLREEGHIQYRGGLSLAQLENGSVPSAPTVA
jgi:peptidoglycan LD-endopeptidase CwlK